MQGNNENILTTTDKLCAMNKKLLLWKKHVEKRNIEMFPSVKIIDDKIIILIIEHLKQITENFEKYFPHLNTEQFDWIRNPFVSSDLSNFTLNEEELTSLSSDRGLKLIFNEFNTEKFWSSV